MLMGGDGGPFLMGLKQIGLIKICFCIKQEHKRYQSQEYFFKVRNLDEIVKRSEINGVEATLVYNVSCC